MIVRPARVKNDKKVYCSNECANNAQKPKWEEIKALFDAKGYELLSDHYVSNKVKLEYICPRHRDYGIQSITYNNIKAGCGCKLCGREQQAEKRRLTIDDVKLIFAKNDIDLVDGQKYVNTSYMMAYICRKHKEIGIQYMCTTNAYKQHCPYCNISHGESAIMNFLNKYNIHYIAQKKYDGLVGKKGKPLSYDFYVPEKNLLIEYQGNFHDGTARIQTEEGYHIQKEHDELKRKYAIDHNISLLEIWYYEFNKIDEILSNYLLESSETTG